MQPLSVLFTAGSNLGATPTQAVLNVAMCPWCRERNDGLYRPITYLVAKMVEELTIFFFLSLLLTVIVFAPCKLGGSYILFWLVNFVTTATGIGAAPTQKLLSNYCRGARTAAASREL